MKKRNNYKKILILSLFFCSFVLLFFCSSVPAADAAGIVPCGRNSGTAEEQAPCTLCHLIVGIKRIIDWGMGILVFVAIASLVVAGIMYIVSAGNDELMGRAKNIMKLTLTGFVIVLGAWLIINYTMVLLGKRGDLGIGVTDWANFTCNTTSNLSQ